MMINQIVCSLFLPALLITLLTDRVCANVNDILLAACRSGQKPESLSCLSACKKVQALHQVSELSHAMSSTCKWSLATWEARGLKEDRTCNRKTCVVRLHPIEKGMDFVGAGYSLSVKEGVYDYYDMKIVDPRGRVTIFGLCGNCGVHEGTYIKGPLRRARAAAAGGLIILKVPR